MIVGYAPGVFDYFHVGHLNVLRRSKLQCDFLIAGVLCDSEVARSKGAPASRSEGKRLELVSAMRFVDRAYLDPRAVDKTPAWEDLHFDVIFKGSDWIGTPNGRALEQSMAAVGTKVVYLPYTTTTSSTSLRRTLTDGLAPTEAS